MVVSESGTTSMRMLFGIIVVLVAVLVILVWANPIKYLPEFRNAQRRADVTEIFLATQNYAIDHAGELPSGISRNRAGICSVSPLGCKELVDLRILIVKDYLQELPVDPKEKSENSTGYTAYKTKNGRLVIEAPLAEEDVRILREDVILYDQL